MSDLPTREEADCLIGYRPVNLDHDSLSLEDRVFLARADGTLMTEAEWRGSDIRLQAIADACRITTDMFYEWRRNDDHTDKKWVWRQIRDLLALAEGEMTAEQFMEAYNSAEFIGDDPWSAYSRDERGMDALTEENSE